MPHMQDSSRLDRESVVPLYYQLQEILKEQIESGRWAPGDALPPEMRLAEQYAVSRVCVRQALAILEDDREIIRIQGRGTFVASRKFAFRPVGLAGLDQMNGRPEIRVRILDTKVGVAERAILTALGAALDDVIRVTALWHRNGTAFAIGQHFYRTDTLTVETTTPGAEISPPLTERSPVRVDITVETTQCGQFEADLLGIANRSIFLLTFGSVVDNTRSDQRPIEVFRLGFPGESVQLLLSA